MPSPGRPFINHPGITGDPPADNPPTPQSEPETPQTPSAEPTPAPKPRLYAGKYKTPEELEAGYQNSFSELERIRSDNAQQLDAERRRYDELVARIQQPPPSPPQDHFAGFAEMGIAPDVIRTAVRAEARAIAREEAQNAVTPLTVGTAARSRVASRYEDFAKVEDQVANFVRSDRDTSERYAHMFGMDPEAAMEWAYMRFRMAHPAETERVSAADNPSEGAITSQAAPPERKPEADTREEEQRGLAYFQKYRDPMPYVRARLKGIIPDSHFTRG